MLGPVSPLQRWTLIALTAFVALGAWYGTWLLLFDSGVLPLDPPAFLPGGWGGGGAALALFVALPMTVAVVLLLRRDVRARRGALAAGALLMVWIAVQVAVIGYVFVLQPVMFVFGGLIVLAALRQWGPGVHSAP
jgi:hypothetical protein